MSHQEKYRLGMAAYHAGRFEKAIELLTPLSEAGPNAQELLSRFYLGQAHYQLAVQWFRERRFREAGRHFQWAARLNAMGGDLARFLVACYVGARQYDLASRELEMAIGQQPDNVELRIRLALSQCKQGNPLQALSTLREGLLNGPYEAEFHYQIGVIHMAQEELADAERSFDLVLARQPDHALAHERLAQIYAVQGRHERARSYLFKAHQLAPDNARIAFQISVLAMSEPAEALDSLMLEAADCQVGFNEEALDRLGQAIAEEPDFVISFLALPPTDMDQEVFSTLAATLERALQAHPEYADLHYHCGEVYRRLGRRMEAIDQAEKAVRINPRYVNALILLADLYAQTDQWAMGAERLEQAIRTGADYPDVHCMLGQLYKVGGRVGEARKAFQRALSLNSRYRPAQEAIASLAH